MAEAAEESLDLTALAQGLELSVPSARMDVEAVEALGLMLSGLDEGIKPILLGAGRQYLQLRGAVDGSVLSFLPRVIDDLRAREALLHAGAVLIDEFRLALLQGDAVEHARNLVPVFEP